MEMKKHVTAILMVLWLGVSGVLAGAPERLAVMSDASMDRLVTDEGQQSSESYWVERSTALRQGNEYLDRYLRRRGLTQVRDLRMEVSGIQCRLRDTSSYGHTSYSLVYSVQVRATLGQAKLWDGEVSVKVLSPSKEPRITDELRLRLVKLGVNEVVRAVARRSGR